MLIIPAIDLYKGNVVRLKRGDPNFSKVYSTDPVSMAKQWEEKGAKLLHVVDLSAALGEGENTSAIKAILKEVNIDVQIGGGIRSLDKAKDFISLGAVRIIVGTKGLDEDFLDDLMALLGKNKVAVGVDVVDSYLAVEGWKKKIDLKGLDFIAYLQLKGIQWVIYTDILRDGTLDGVNFKSLDGLSSYKKLNIIVSGGVSSLEDIQKIKEDMPFIRGVIVGKAFYEGKIDMKNINIDNL